MNLCSQSIIRENIILFTPKSEDIAPYMEALEQSPYSHLITKGGAIVTELAPFFYFEFTENKEKIWKPYSEELAQQGTWIFNNSDYHKFKALIDFLSTKFTLKEMLTQIFVLNVDW
jgi:hypothetical protein